MSSPILQITYENKINPFTLKDLRNEILDYNRLDKLFIVDYINLLNIKVNHA